MPGLLPKFQDIHKKGHQISHKIKKSGNDTRFTLVAHEISSGVDLVLTDMSSFFTSRRSKNSALDPGFPRYGAKVKRRRQPIIWAKYAENCMKMKKIGLRGGIQISLCRPTTENV